MDVFKTDSTEVDVLKVVCLLWKSRENKDRVESLGNLLSDAARNSDAIISDAEYYLPQLCHMVIHLEVAWESQALERFAFTISQKSIHIALQLSFYLRAAMEDYQPEKGPETSNPFANPVLFYRCARLLQNIERAVVFGTTVSVSNDKLPEAHASTILSSNKANALIVTDDGATPSVRKGYLLFKRNTRKSTLHSKIWKPRFFRIEQQVMFCLRNETDTLALRAMSLIGCSVTLAPANSKYPYAFELSNAAGTAKYQLRAEDEKSYQIWTSALLAERGVFNLQVPVRADSNALYAPAGPDSIDSHFDIMTSTQRKRAHFFRQQIAFTDKLTSICESLRFVDQSHRKFFLARDLKDLCVPPFSYVPMCSSLDTFSYILRPLPAECHAFTTKARVPALMLFEVEEHPKAVNVMSFLDLELPAYSDSELGAVPRDLVGSDAAAGAEHVELTEQPGTGASRMNKAIDSTKSPPRLSSASPRAVGAGTDSTALSPVIVSTSASIPEQYCVKQARLKAVSPFSHLPQWSLRGLIAKSNDDVRQEVFIMQLIAFYQRAFQQAGLPLWLFTYTILSTSKTTGLIELIPNAYSIDSIKKRSDFPGSLRLYYEQMYGTPVDGVEPPSLKMALTEFVKSMASYSIVCYLLEIKDRHNGNIMIDTSGHIIHIDFGFVFGLAPGKAFSMEKRCPWKLNKEMVAVMGGLSSPYYADYVSLCVEALSCARKCSKAAVVMMEILTYKSNFPAFRYNPDAIDEFKRRLLPRVADADLESQVKRMLYTSYDNAGSNLYDQFQLATNGIAV